MCVFITCWFFCGLLVDSQIKKCMYYSTTTTKIEKMGCLVPLNLFVMFLNMCINLNFLIIQSNFWYSYYDSSITFIFFIQFFFSKFIHFMFSAKLYAKIIFLSLPQLLPQRERERERNQLIAHLKVLTFSL